MILADLIDTHLLTVVCGFIALLYIGLTILSVINYRNTHSRKLRFVNRCKTCYAEVLEPVVLNNDEMKKQIVQSAAGLAFGMAGFHAHFGTLKSSVQSKVLYYVDDKKIITVIQRKAGLRHPKPGDMISIFYDPELPEHAFAQDMKSVMLDEPLTECIIYGIVAFVMLLTFLILMLNPETIYALFAGH